MTKKYKITTSVEREYEAENEDVAREMFWEDIETTPQQTIETFFEEHTEVTEIKDEV